MAKIIDDDGNVRRALRCLEASLVCLGDGGGDQEENSPERDGKNSPERLVKNSPERLVKNS
ncbi:MAG: hypothetical protein O6945_11980 [Gammaproteobacteria bacterium]|nr:hypothetical protein [Gammaproteobacteria bacterium]